MNTVGRTGIVHVLLMDTYGLRIVRLGLTLAQVALLEGFAGAVATLAGLVLGEVAGHGLLLIGGDTLLDGRDGLLVGVGRAICEQTHLYHFLLLLGLGGRGWNGWEHEYAHQLNVST